MRSARGGRDADIVAGGFGASSKRPKALLERRRLVRIARDGVDDDRRPDDDAARDDPLRPGRERSLLRRRGSGGAGGLGGRRRRALLAGLERQREGPVDAGGEL